MLTADILLIAVAAFVSAVVSGLGGFGGAFVIIIVLTPIVGPKAVIPLIAVYAVCNNVSRIYIYRQTIDWRLAVQFTLASLPGVYVGAHILAVIPERALFGLLGLAIASGLVMRIKNGLAEDKIVAFVARARRAAETLERNDDAT